MFIMVDEPIKRYQLVNVKKGEKKNIPGAQICHVVWAPLFVVLSFLLTSVPSDVALFVMVVEEPIKEIYIC